MTVVDGNYTPRDTAVATAPAASFADGAVVGIGALPHRDAAAAADFSITEFGIATIPTLPKRSPAEAMVAQAVVGLPGVSLGPYGSIAIDPARVDDTTAIRTDLAQDAFVGMRTFLDRAGRFGLDGAPVKWQFVGPVTLGVALHRAGLDTDLAFDVALRAVRSHLAALADAIAGALPNSPQMMFLDEPWLTDLMRPDFPVPPDRAIDLMSSGMAVLGNDTVVGLHCCADVDLATLLATGPRAISIPVGEALLDWAGYLARFLDDGGVIAWGVIPSDGPLPASSERYWRALSDLWCSLVQRGCDPVKLRRQSLVSPTCGLGSHSVPVALRIAELTAEVGKRVGDQADATRFALGA
ncbi:MAG: hypothetical protein QNM02_00960 [Acidimicrobiia bacterium]|nr:hypothetical protein [Acidimicrobiia bacterium]